MNQHVNPTLAPPQPNKEPKKTPPPPAPLEQPSLCERAKALRSEIVAAIEAKAEAQAVSCVGVPRPVLEHLLYAKGAGCLCRAILEIGDNDT
jgi:hypothetical protein